MIIPGKISGSDSKIINLGAGGRIRIYINLMQRIKKTQKN